MKLSLLLVLLSVSAPFSIVHAEAMRCGVHLVKENTALPAVVDTCGAPTQSTHRVEHIARSTVDKQGNVSTFVADVEVDELSYDFGPTAFVYHLRFENGWMTSMRKGERGTAH